VIVGSTGVGKSSLANVLLGCGPNDKDGCGKFAVCKNMDSCTKETSYIVGQWLGHGGNVTVVDTPGFGDSDGEEAELVEGMIDYLSNTIDHADTILVLLKGTMSRFQKVTEDMLKRMTIIFGKNWWDHVVIGVSFWKFNQDSIDDRIAEEQDETWFKEQITGQLCDKLHVCKDFDFVFADSQSQLARHKEDPQQQLRFQQETDKLWNLTTNRAESFSFKTIDDILAENSNLKDQNSRQKREIAQLADVIHNNITQLSQAIQVNNAHLNAEVRQLKDEKEEINTALGQLKDEKEALGKDIKTNNAHLNMEIKQLKDDKQKINTALGQLKENMNILLPVGSIIAWVSKPSSSTSHDLTESLPRGWVRCSGTLITEGRWKGQLTPDINNAKKFLRGGPDGHERQMEDWAMVNHHHNAHSDPHTHSYSDIYMNSRSTTKLCGGSYWGLHTRNVKTEKETVDVHVEGVKVPGPTNLAVENLDNETRPTNMKVIYIMRVF